MFSPFNPYKCTHTWSSGQPTLQRSGSSWGFGALLKGLTSVVDKSCRSRDSNPQPQVTSRTCMNCWTRIYPFRFLWEKGWDLSPYSIKMLTSSQVLLAALLRVEFMRETMCRSLMTSYYWIDLSSSQNYSDRLVHERNWSSAMTNQVHSWNLC